MLRSPAPARFARRDDRGRAADERRSWQGESFSGSESTREAVLRATGLRQAAGGVELLHGISLAVGRGELVAVLGPSGAGKSLLVELLAGAARPSGGAVTVFGRDGEEARGRVGYVPQGEVVHDALTVREALVTTLRLRAPHLAASSALLESRVARTVVPLGLAHRLDARIQRLSGGERRRVSLAIELVTDPDVLVVDEVTSGLDAGAERQVMEALARVVGTGASVVCVTHTLGCADLFHRVLVLVRGRLVFDGPPAGALERFDVPAMEALYDRLGERSPEAWEEAFRDRPAPGAPARDAAPPPRLALPGPAGLWQLPTLVTRGLVVTVRDGRSLLLMLAQAPVIAALVAFAYDAGGLAGRAEVAFKLALSAIWLGCVSACQELVKERAIYRRERQAGVSPHAYLTARALVMLAVCAAQALSLTAVTYALEPLGEPMAHTLVALTAAAACGGALGLVISSAVKTRTAAVALTPLALVPQVLFVGTLEPLQGVAAALGRAMPSHWANEATRRVLLDGAGVPLAEVGTLAAYAALLLLLTWMITLTRDALERTTR